MIPLVFVWPEGVAFWLIYLWIGIPEWRVLRGKGGLRARSSQDAGSVRVIAVGGQFSSLAAFASAFLLPGATLTPYRTAVYWAGVVCLLAAGLLRRHCFRVLGESFTGSVIVQKDQQIIERGAYRWVRHPSYSAAFLLYFASGLALTNWVSIVVFVGTAVVMYSYRITVEERALVEILGEPYRSYMRRTKRLIPFLL